MTRPLPRCALLLALTATGACFAEPRPPASAGAERPRTQEETARHARAVQLARDSETAEALGQIARAEAQLLAARDLFATLGDRDNEARVWIRLGCLATRTGNPGQGLERLATAQARLPAGAEPAVRSTLLACLADASSPPRSPRPNPRQAAHWYGKAIRLSASAGDFLGLVYALNGLGNLRVHQVDFTGARRAYGHVLEQSRRHPEPHTAAVALHNLAWCHLKENDLEAAGRLFQEALTAAEGIRDSALVAEAAGGLGRVARARGDLPEAWRQLKRTLAISEEARTKSGGSESAAGAFSTVQDHFDMAQAVLLELEAQQPGKGHLATAFAVSQRARGRWLLDVLPQGPGEPGPRLPVPLAEVQRDLLDDGTLLLQLDLGEAQSHLWAISRRRAEVFPLPALEALEPPARELHRRLAEASPSAQQPHIDRLAAELGRLLLAPVAARLGSYPRLLVAAEGAFLNLPFEILTPPGRGALVESHEISYAASPSVATWLARAPPRPPGPAAVLFDPVFDPDDPRLEGRAAGAVCAAGPLNALPQTAREAAEILRLLPPGRLAASGTEANKALVTGGALGGAELIHFGTHAVFAAGRPERSGIFLSCFDRDGRPLDALLTVPEIRRLRLSAELVVVSACDSARGDELRGEGVVGLAHAFFQAGARRTLGSLWRVRDDATAELMARFHRGLLADGLSPAAALARAKRETSRDPRFREPYFWAGFVLQGPFGRAGYTKAAGRGSAPASHRPHFRDAGL